MAAHPRSRSAVDNVRPDAVDYSGVSQCADDDAGWAAYCRNASSSFHGDVFDDDSRLAGVPLLEIVFSSSSAALG